MPGDRFSRPPVVIPSPSKSVHALDSETVAGATLGARSNAFEVYLTPCNPQTGLSSRARKAYGLFPNQLGATGGARSGR